jgi:hypothetical protein
MVYNKLTSETGIAKKGVDKQNSEYNLIIISWDKKEEKLLKWMSTI